MALINCPECGKEGVSNTSTSCPQCGYNIKKHFDDIDKAEIAKQNEIKKAKNMKSFKKLVKICIVSLVSVLIICGIINIINDSIAHDAHNLTREGNFNEALTKAEKIIFDDDLKNSTKSDTILYSYLADCKRSCLDSDKSIFNRWFTDDGSCHIYSVKFYDTYSGIYDGYPICILSDYDTTQSQFCYIYFVYDTEEKHYEFRNEVIGLVEKADDSLAKNSSREFISSVIRAYPEIQTHYIHSLAHRELANGDNWENIELLEPYNNYF